MSYEFIVWGKKIFLPETQPVKNMSQFGIGLINNKEKQVRWHKGFNAEPMELLITRQSILHLYLHLQFAFSILHLEFKFPAKNSEIFRFKCLNFPPKNWDVIVVGVVVGHGDNSAVQWYLFQLAFQR